MLKLERDKLQKEREDFDAREQKFEQELVQMEQMHQIQVGGVGTKWVNRICHAKSPKALLFK